MSLFHEGINVLITKTDFHPALSVGVIGSCAADVYEPRQIFAEATVNGPLWVSQGSLITLTGRAGRKSVFVVLFDVHPGVDLYPVLRIT